MSKNSFSKSTDKRGLHHYASLAGLRFTTALFLPAVLFVAILLLASGCKKKSKVKGVEEVKISVGNVEFTMTQVLGGSFLMGAADNNDVAAPNEKPGHHVTVSTFWIGKTEVTQQLWVTVMGNNPSFFRGDDLPVEQVSWNDCQEFVRRLSTMTGRQFRLPTEAEWEFAARGGTRSNNYTYSGGDAISDVGWYWGNGRDKTHVVGSKRANELGLHDMTGNVWEWCQDWYGYYSAHDQVNPRGARTGRLKVNRGGCWYFEMKASRNSARFANKPDGKYKGVGLRLVM